MKSSKTTPLKKAAKTSAPKKSAPKKRAKGDTQPFRVGMKEFYPAPDVAPYDISGRSVKAHLAPEQVEAPDEAKKSLSRQSKSLKTRADRKSLQMAQTPAVRRQAHSNGSSRRQERRQEVQNARSPNGRRA